MRILYLLHSYYNVAGTEEHTRMLVEGLSAGHTLFVAAPDGERIVLIEGSREIAAFRAPHLPWPVSPIHSEAHEAALKKILLQTRPDIVHIQHFMNWPLSVFEQIYAYGAPVVMSFHDYFPITPHFTMRGIVDPLVTLEPKYSIFHFGQDISPYLRNRRAIVSEGLSKLALRITPSKFLVDLFQGVFPGSWTVVTHGIRPFEPSSRTSSETLRFGYIGSLLPQKGYRQLLGAFERVHEKFPEVVLHMFGGRGRAEIKEQKGVTFHGAYRPDMLSQIISSFDVGVIPSVFMETFSLVLSELWHAKTPVAASAIGALPERIEDGVTGKLFKPGDIESMEAALRWFIENCSWKKWEIPRVKLLDAMAEEYERLYRSLV